MVYHLASRPPCRQLWFSCGSVCGRGTVSSVGPPLGWIRPRGSASRSLEGDAVRVGYAAYSAYSGFEGIDRSKLVVG